MKEYKYKTDLSKLTYCEKFEEAIYNLICKFGIKHEKVGSVIYYNRKFTNIEKGKVMGYAMALSDFVDEGDMG